MIRTREEIMIKLYLATFGLRFNGLIDTIRDIVRQSLVTSVLVHREEVHYREPLIIKQLCRCLEFLCRPRQENQEYKVKEKNKHVYNVSMQLFSQLFDTQSVLINARFVMHFMCINLSSVVHFIVTSVRAYLFADNK